MPLNAHGATIPNHENTWKHHENIMKNMFLSTHVRISNHINISEPFFKNLPNPPGHQFGISWPSILKLLELRPFISYKYLQPHQLECIIPFTTSYNIAIENGHL